MSSVNNPIRRHVAGVGKPPYDVVESDLRWGGMARIVVINADHRADRLDAVMKELAMAGAPLVRALRQPAVFQEVTGDKWVDGQIGCLKSHRDSLRLAVPRQGEHVLILEDDFCFTSDFARHLDDLWSFTERRYDYVICLLATSKNGRIEPRDDLVSESRQPCTNSAAYLVSGDHYDRLSAMQENAIEQLIATRDPNRYAADRYWSGLGPEGRLLSSAKKWASRQPASATSNAGVSRYLD